MGVFLSLVGDFSSLVGVVYRDKGGVSAHWPYYSQAKFNTMSDKSQMCRGARSSYNGRRPQSLEEKLALYNSGCLSPLMGVFLSLVGVVYQDKGGISAQWPTILKPYNE